MSLKKRTIASGAAGLGAFGIVEAATGHIRNQNPYYVENLRHHLDMVQAFVNPEAFTALYLENRPLAGLLAFSLFAVLRFATCKYAKETHGHKSGHH